MRTTTRHCHRKELTVIRALPWILAGLAALSPFTATAADSPFTKIDVYPPDVNLQTLRDRQSFIVVGTYPDGVTVDLTGKAEVALADSKFARIDGNTLHPLADGQTTLNIKAAGHEASIPVHVSQAAEDRPISFKLDVMPVFLRTGCNIGSCHGAARGKDGFMLSLFGYDPDGDHFRLTRELGTRRINLASPAECLLIEKSVGAVPHTGGKRFDVGSEYYDAIMRWLEARAPLDAGEIPTVVAVELYPPRMVLQGEGATQQLVARARYSDGTDRDITSLAVFATSNDNSAQTTADGLITAANRGEAFLTARYDTITVGVQAIVLPAELQYQKPQEAPVNYIDELVANKLHDLRITPSEICSDEVFLRRVTIDITGLLPTEEEYHQFVNDTAPNKRANLVDRLLERKEFSEIWAMKWSEILMLKSTNQVSYKSIYLYYNWLMDKIANDVPLDKMVQELLAASGGTFKNPATNFYQIERDTLKTSENVAQIFMGIQTQCAQCHNHPFDRWTMDDYYGFAAFFAQIGRKRGEDYRETIVYNSGGGDVRHPVGNRVMPPKFLGGEAPDTRGKDRRELLAKWITSAENPFFSTSVANRIWEHFFGLGVVEPVDDIRISNPPSNPALFDALGKKLIEYNYDFKQLVRDICNSNTYQRTTRTNDSNETDTKNFAYARFRRLRAESLLDCISQVTDTQEKFRGLPLGARAVQVADGTTSNYFLDTFGRSPRLTACACEATTSPTLSQSLHLLNGTTVEGKIRSGGLVRNLVKDKTPDEVIDTLYIRALSRKPTEEERQKLMGLFEEGADANQVLEDVFWAILNSREFMFNH